jgi:hypothetical protein
MPSSANPRILLRPTNFLPSLGKLYPKKNIVEYCDRKGDEHPKNNPEKKMQRCSMLDMAGICLTTYMREA